MARRSSLEVLFRVVDEVSGTMRRIQRTLGGFVRAVTAPFRSFFNVITSVRTALFGAFGFLAARAGARSVKAIIEHADAMGELAAATGEAVENLSELEFAFEKAGIDGAAFESVLRALNRSRAEAVDGNRQLVETFAALGITIGELRTLGPAQLLEQIAAGLEQFETAQDRAMVLARILPRDFQRLNALVGRGLVQFQKDILDARQSGATITADQARALSELDDAFLRVRKAFEAVTRAILETFGPDVTAALNRFATAVVENKDAIRDLAVAIGEGLVKAVSLAIDAVIALIDVIDSIPGVSLIDEAALRREITTLQRQLALIRAAVDPQGLRAQRTQQGAAGFAEFEGRERLIAEAQRDKERILRELVPREEEIRARLAELETTLTAGLAGAMRLAREQFEQELARLRALAAAGQSPLGGSVPPGESAFRERGGVPRGEADPEGRQQQLAIQDRMRRLQVEQQVAQLLPALLPVQRALAEIERQQFVLGLEAAVADGVGNATELAAAIGIVNAEFERLNSTIRGGDPFGGFVAGARQVVQEFTDLTQAGIDAGKQIAELGLSGVTQALTDAALGTRDLGEAFRDLGRQALQVLAQLIAKMAALAVVSAIFPGAGGIGGLLAEGGVTRGVQRTVPARRFARGGVARQPTFALFGEAGEEAFVPLEAGRIPVQLQGAGAGGGQVNIVIHAADGESVRKMLTREGDHLVRIIGTGMGMRTSLRSAVREVR